MPSPVQLSLDHAGAIVRDLAAGAARWEKLGFSLSPLSRQRGKMPDREEEGPWATANRCAIFAQGYLELIGIVDEACFNPWATFLDRREGLHLLALRVPDADLAYAEFSERSASLRAGLNPPVQRARKLDVDGVERTMAFRNIFSRDEHFPEGRYIVLKHQTPAYLWQPRYLSHPNGALALESVMLCASDLPAQRARIGALLDQPGVEGPDRVLVFTPPGGGSIRLYGADEFASAYGWAPAAPASFAGAEVRFASLAQAAKTMEDNGVPVCRRGRHWFVGPGDTGGFVLQISE